MDPLNSCYVGIVVQNNDPEKRGRVKVFIPHLSVNLYEKWYNVNIHDKSFKTLNDDGEESQVNNILDQLKDYLPWANCAMPIIGEIGNHYFNASENKVYTKDNVEKTDEKPIKTFEDSPQIAYEEEYKPISYSSSAKGLFSIPRVGSHVWCFFENGDIQRPVYFATTYSQSDWESIYYKESDEYPDAYENDKDSSSEYKNKLIISQRGGTVEIVNTDNKESIAITHYNGSFKIWNNTKTKEFCVQDNHKLIQNDEYETVGNDEKRTVINDQTEDIGNDQTKTVGNNQSITIGNAQSVTVGSGGITVQ
jgi:hypothetical protein